MRKRVLLKSPVQPVRRTGEDRTPGSVRGLLGNWQSYRDGGLYLATAYPGPVITLCAY